VAAVPVGRVKITAGVSHRLRRAAVIRGERPFDLVSMCRPIAVGRVAQSYTTVRICSPLVYLSADEDRTIVVVFRLRNSRASNLGLHTLLIFFFVISSCCFASSSFIAAFSR